MNEFRTFCPHCQAQLAVPVEYAGQQVKCATCNKTFMAQKTAFKKQTPPKPIPDGYDTAMWDVGFLKVVGCIGIVFGVLVGIFLSDLSETLAVGCAIAGVLLALPWFISAAFLNLFCGIAKSTAYTAVLLEYELQNRE